MAEIDPVLAEVLAPVREKIASLDAEIVELENQLALKREELRPYRRVLTAANGQKPGPRAKKSQKRLGRDAVEETDAQIRKLFGDGTEFTATDVYRNWTPVETRLGSDRITRATRELHSVGVIRLMRRGKGGSTIYRVVDS